METIPANAAEGIDAKLQVRGSCHGKSGVPINATTPIIWGQQEFFLVMQLHDYDSDSMKSIISHRTSTSSFRGAKAKRRRTRNPVTSDRDCWIPGSRSWAFGL
jgi:hypothetical protein